MTTDSREVLTSAMLQHAVPLQNTKRDAFSQILMKIVYLGGEAQPLSIQEIISLYNKSTYGGIISESLVRTCMRSLSDQGRVSQERCSPDTFRITGKGVDELSRAEGAAKESLDAILSRHFGSNRLPASSYGPAFIHVISKVAASLGFESAAFLVGRANAFERLNNLQEPIEEAAATFPDLDQDVLVSGVNSFLTTRDPESHAFLWNVTQSFFVSKILGLDPTGTKLGREVFRRSEFVADTNVLYALMSPSDQLHNVAMSTVKALHALSIRHVFLPQTIDELNHVISRDSERLEQIVAKGGGKWLSRLDSAIVRDFSESELSIESFQDAYHQAEAVFVQKYGFDRLNGRPIDDEEAAALAEALKRLSIQKSSGQRTKRDAVAEHDATLLLLARDRRRSTKLVTWVLSFDAVLTDAPVPDWDNGPLSIHPRVVLQWVGTAAGSGAFQQAFANAFASLVEARFFPDENFLRTGHFLQLIATNEKILNLPDRDVESILREIEQYAPQLDMESYEGREVLSGIMVPALLDPHSETQAKLKQERERHELEIAALRNEREAQDAARKREIELIRGEQVATSERLDVERANQANAEIIRDRDEAMFRFWVFVLLCLGSACLGALVAWRLLAETELNKVIRFGGPLLVFMMEIGILKFVLQIVGCRLVGEHRAYALDERYKELLGA